MTIAVCCVSPEGIALGADSTTSYMAQGGGFHYLNHNQKIFEVGQKSALGILTWGLASVGSISHRTLVAQLGDVLNKSSPASVASACESWVDIFWPNYQTFWTTQIALVRSLDAKSPYDAGAPLSADMRTDAEESTYQQLKMGLVVGFCIGGHILNDRTPTAFEMIFDPLSPHKPVPAPISETRCWGAPKVFSRIVHGIDPEITQAIINSGKWSGTTKELETLMGEHQLYLPNLPMRDAIDFVHSCIASTIKTLKFSHLSQTCGGPIEIAVITSDRDFRWVRHKEWDAAIKEGHAEWKI